MSSSLLFSMLGKEVVVTDLNSGDVVWSGQPLGRGVLDVVQVSDGSRALVLLDYYKTPPNDRGNLVAIDDHGGILWRATLPTSSATDAFTEVELTAEGVSAFTWSGHRVLIDLATGKTVKDSFVK